MEEAEEELLRVLTNLKERAVAAEGRSDGRSLNSVAPRPSIGVRYPSTRVKLTWILSDGEIFVSVHTSKGFPDLEMDIVIFCSLL